MKKLYLIIAFLVFFGVAAHANEQEEIDFLLFLPNSGSGFADETKAAIQLDGLAEYFKRRNLDPAQICVYGYAADAVNDIEPMNLSRDRALFVTNELQKRGVSRDLFSDPIGYGAVDLWGSNSNEEARIPNRRVRILLDGKIVTPAVMSAAVPEIKVPVADFVAPTAHDDSAGKAGCKCPWKILLPLFLLALIAAILFLLFRKKRRTESKTMSEAAPLSVVSNVPEKVVAPIVAVPAEKVSVVDLEEEIRFRAYELSLERGWQNGDMDGDWFVALPEICSRYEAAGYQVYTEDGSWKARRSSR